MTVLNGASLTLADLRGTNLSGTFMNGVNLANAQFLRKDFESAIVSNITISLYFFGNITEEKERDLIHQLAAQLEEFGKLQFLGGRWKVLSPKNVMGEIIQSVSDIKSLELIQGIISNHPWIKAFFIYADEYEKFIATIPDSLRPECEKFIGLWLRVGLPLNGIPPS